LNTVTATVVVSVKIAIAIKSSMSEKAGGGVRPEATVGLRGTLS
jgi:hypothetical protein